MLYSIVIILVVAKAFYEISFWRAHRNPLTKEELSELSRARSIEWINGKCKFKNGTTTVNHTFRSRMNPDGKLYSIRIPLQESLMTVSELLKHKRHEWYVFLLADYDEVKLMWANKGDDGLTCYYSGDFSSLIYSGRKMDCCTVIRIHNHPGKESVMRPSEQDLKSNESLKSLFAEAGFNFLDAVCVAGAFHVFGANFLDCNYPYDAKSIERENGISDRQNYKLHLELRRKKRIKIRVAL